MRLSRLIRLLLVTAVLAACASTRPYNDTALKNLTITTRTDSGSIVSSVSVSLDIYHVNRQCEASYQGSVALDKARTRVGLPTSQVSFLVFRFNRSGFLSSSSSVISSETLLRPRRQYHYQADVHYDAGIYNVDILEQRAAGSKGKEVQPLPLSACQHLS